MKPSTNLCELVRCHKFWFDGRCGVTGMVPGHMSHCPEKLLNSYDGLLEVLAIVDVNILPEEVTEV